MNLHNIFKFLQVFLLLLFAVKPLFAGNSITRIVTEPNRVILYGVGNVPKPNVYLNAEKTKLIAAFKGVSADEKARVAFGKGMMNDIDVIQQKGECVVYVQLKEKQGFTTSVLPYSDALVIDVFSWDKLAANDDLYRSGLLALSDGIVNQALPLLQQSSDKGNGDASFFLGVELLKQARYDEALGTLKKALQQQTTLHDVYAALCQIYRVNGLEEEAKRYENLFNTKSGIRSVLDIPVEYQPPLSSDGELSEGEPISLASMISETEVPDSLSTSTKGATDTSRFASLFSGTTTDSQNKVNGQVISNASLMPEWMKTASLAVIGVIASVFVTVIVLYSRWRKKRSMEMEEEEDGDETQTDNENFAKIFAQESNKPRTNVQNALTSYAGQNIDNLISDDTLDTKNVHPNGTMLAPDRTMLEEFVNDVLEKGKSAVEKGRNFVEDKKQILTTGVFEPDSEEESVWEDEVTSSPPRGEYELALHLHAKQRIHRSESLEELDITTIPEQKFSMSKIAKKLGVETGSLETKKSFSQLETDSRALNELKRKFSKHDSVRFAR